MLESDPLVQGKGFSTRGKFAHRGHLHLGCHHRAQGSRQMWGWACRWHLGEEAVMLAEHNAVHGSRNKEQSRPSCAQCEVERPGCRVTLECPPEGHLGGPVVKCLPLALTVIPGSWD